MIVEGEIEWLKKSIRREVDRGQEEKGWEQLIGYY